MMEARMAVMSGAMMGLLYNAWLEEKIPFRPDPVKVDGNYTNQIYLTDPKDDRVCYVVTVEEVVT